MFIYVLTIRPTAPNLIPSTLPLNFRHQSLPHCVMSTIEHKDIVTSGILGVDPGFKALNWRGNVDTMFSLGIIHLLAWFAATQVHITDIYAQTDVCEHLIVSQKILIDTK
jgi:hypothetical protein